MTSGYTEDIAMGQGRAVGSGNSIAAEAVPASRVKADHSRSTWIMIRLHSREAVTDTANRLDQLRGFRIDFDLLS